MSYPPQPGQDPNNPYAQQPPQQQQPGYGYPPQKGGLPGYGGPAEAAGYGAPTSMPGTLNAARIMLYVIGGLSAVGAVLTLIAAAALGSIADDPNLQGEANLDMYQDLGTGLIALIGVVYLGFAVGGFVLALKFSKGGNGVRTGAIVYGALTIVVGLIAFPVGLIFVIMAGVIIAFVVNADGKAWFNRPRY